MKTIIKLLACFVCIPAFAGNFIFTAADVTQQTQGVRSLRLIPLEVSSINPLGFTAGDAIDRTTDTNSTVTVSNLISGYYLAIYRGPYQSTTNYYNFPSTNGTDYATNYVGDSVYSAVPSYSKAVSDRRYLRGIVSADGNATVVTSNGVAILSVVGGSSIGPTNGLTSNQVYSVSTLATSNTVNSAAYHPAGDFYSSGNPSGYQTAGQVSSAISGATIAASQLSGTIGNGNLPAALQPLSTNNAASLTNLTQVSYSAPGVLPATATLGANLFPHTDANSNLVWTTQSPVSPTFDLVGTGTNSGALMGVGAGSALNPAGGTITATFAQSANASTIVGGGVGGHLSQNTIITNTPADGDFITTAGASFKSTKNGSGLTNLNASSLASGTVPAAQLAGQPYTLLNLTAGDAFYLQKQSNGTEWAAVITADGNITNNADGHFSWLPAMYFLGGMIGDASGLTKLSAAALSGTLPTAVTNSLGQVPANAIMGIVYSGAATNNNVVTLPSPAFPASLSADLDGAQHSITNLASISATNISADTFTIGKLIATNLYGNGSGLTNLGGVVNVLDYGASTNLADNSAAFAAAIQAATNNVTTPGFGGTIIVPRGQFKLLSTLYLYPGMMLKGSSREGTELYFPNAVSNCVQFVTNNFTGSRDILVAGVENLTIRNPWNGGITNSGDAINIYAGSTIYYFTPVIRNVTINVSGRRGIYLGRFIGGVVDNVNEAYATNEGVFVSGGPLVIQNSYFHQNFGYGIRVNASGGVQILASASDNNNQGGILLDGHTVDTVLSASKTEQNGGSQFWIDDSVNTVIEGCSAYQGTGSTSTNGITINGAEGVVLRQNYLGPNGGATASGWAIYVTPSTSLGLELSYELESSWGLGVISDPSRFQDYNRLSYGMEQWNGPNGFVTVSNGTFAASAIRGLDAGITNASGLSIPTQILNATNGTVNAAGTATYVTGNSQTLTNTVNMNIRLGASFDGGGSVLGAQQSLPIPIDFSGTITGVRLTSTLAGSVTVDLWKSAAPTPPTVANSITASSKPTLSSAFYYVDTTLSGWTKTVSSNDWLVVSISSPSIVTNLGVVLTIKSTNQ